MALAWSEPDPNGIFGLRVNMAQGKQEDDCSVNNQLSDNVDRYGDLSVPSFAAAKVILLQARCSVASSVAMFGSIGLRSPRTQVLTLPDLPIIVPPAAPGLGYTPESGPTDRGRTVLSLGRHRAPEKNDVEYDLKERRHLRSVAAMIPSA